MKNFFVRTVEEAARTGGAFFKTKYGSWLLGGISFLESALPLPLLTDPFLSAYILADKSRVAFGVFITTITSIAGGVAAYLMAAGFYSVLTNTVLTGATLEEFHSIATILQDSVFWFTLAGAFTPVPYTLVGLAAGFVEANILLFILASVIGRGTRYAIVGYLTYHFGEQALQIARQRILLTSIVGFVLVVVYFLLH